MKQEFTNKNSACGFTLIEILIYIAILLVLIGTIISFVLWSIQISSKARVMREVLDNARRAIDRISYEAREAKSIYGPTTSSNQLSLETAKYSGLEEETSYIDFFLCDARLCLKRESQVPLVLTSDNVEITNLVFTRIVTGDINSVKTDLTIRYKNPANREEFKAEINLNSTVSLRSY